METINCKSWDEVKHHQDAWMKLQEVSEVSIFSTYQFLECFWFNFEKFNHLKFGKKKELNVLFFYKESQLIGVLPLVKVTRLRKKVIPIKYLELLGQPFFTSYLDVVSKNIFDLNWPDIMQFIADNINFHVMNLGSSLYQLIGSEKLTQYSVSPMIVTEGFRDFEEYRRNGMSKNFQKILSNSANRIQKTGKSYHFQWDNYNSKSHFSWVNKISESKKSDGKYNVFDYPEMRQFIEGVFNIFNAKICTLYLDNTPIAYQVYLYYHNQCMWFDLSFDRAYRDLRPGILIYEEGLKYNFGFDNILGYGQDQNKMGMANVVTPVFLYRTAGNACCTKWILKMLD